MYVSLFHNLSSLNNYLRRELKTFEAEKMDAATLAPRISCIAETISVNSGRWCEDKMRHPKGIRPFMKLVKELRHLARQGGEETLEAKKSVNKAVKVFAEHFPVANTSLHSVKKLCIYSQRLYLKTLAVWIAEKKIAINQLNLSSQEILDLAPYLTYLRIVEDHFENGVLESLLQKAANVTHVRIEKINLFCFKWTDFGSFQKIKNLEFDDCGAFFFNWPKDLSSLETLSVRNCPKLRSIPQGMHSLRELTLEHCKALCKPLPNDMESLKHLNLDSIGTYDTESTLPYWLINLEHFSFRGMTNSQTYFFLQFIYFLYKRDEERAVRFAASSGWNERAFLLYRHFAKECSHHIQKIIELVDKITPEKLEILIKNNDVPFVMDKRVKLEPHLQLHIYHLASLISEESFSLLKQYLRPFVHFASRDDLEKICIVAALIPNLDRVLKMAQEQAYMHSYDKLLYLAYLQFLESDSDCVVQNLINAVREFGSVTVIRSIPPTPLSAKMLSVPNIFTGNRNEDYDVKIFLQFLLASGLGGLREVPEASQRVIQRFPLIREYIKSLIDTEKGRHLIQEDPAFYLNMPLVQEIILEVYPLENPENVPLYPFRIALLKGRHYFTYLRGMVAQHPDLVMQQLCECSDLKSISVRQFGSKAVDQGGPGREFFAELFIGIVSNSQYFSFETSDDGKLVPSPKTGMTESDDKKFITLGMLLGIAARRHYQIGDLFSRKFFEAIFSLPSPIMDLKEFWAAKDNPAFVRLMHACCTPNDRWSDMEAILLSDDLGLVKTKAEYLNAGWCDDTLAKAIEWNDFEGIRSTVRSIWCEDYLGYFRIAHTIAYGMSMQFPMKIEMQLIRQWEDLKVMSTEAWTLHIQGQMTPEWIKANIIVDGENEELLDDLRGLIALWIDAHAEDNKALINFVKTITGSPTLSGKITFVTTDNPDIKAPLAQTCPKTVFVPDGIEEESFLLTLDSWGRGENTGFNLL